MADGPAARRLHGEKKAADRRNAGADLPRLLRIRTEMIDPTATGTVERPSADLPRPRGREAPSAYPSAPVDDRTTGCLGTTGGEHIGGARNPISP